MGRQKLFRVSSTYRSALHTCYSTISSPAQHAGTVAGAEASTSGRKTELVWRQTRQLAYVPGRSVQSARSNPQQLRMAHGMSTQGSVQDASRASGANIAASPRAASSVAEASAGVTDEAGASAAGRQWNWPLIGVAGAFAAGAVAAVGTNHELERAAGTTDEEPDETHFVNWSGTHEVTPKRFYQPESVEELERVVAEAHEKGQKLRAVGSALSPNGLAFSTEGMVSLTLLDKLLDVDRDTGRVTVQSGARVQELVEQLRPYGLTLQNYASIREQSIGGFVQVSAHGTGARIPPVDEQVVALKLVTPAEGTLELSEEQDPELFRLSRVGLGLLGIVSEVTLQCVPAHQLLEHTFVASLREVRRNHNKWLRENQHLRYMWLPYTDAIVVVTNNPVPEGTAPPRWQRDTYSPAERTAPLRDLLVEKLGNDTPSDLEGLSSTQLRDRLLDVAPSDRNWVARVNQAEAEFWRRSEGYQVGWSDQLLGFDCGGQQWVLENAIPTGSLRRPSGADLRFMEDLMRLLDENDDIAAPCPIEQRWTASSSSDMSPASSPGQPDTLHSWIGIIMYLPEHDEAKRAAVAENFRRYAQLMDREILPRYGGVPHWAKLELDHMGSQRTRECLAERYPVGKLNAARERLDPNNILSNPIMDAAFLRRN